MRLLIACVIILLAWATLSCGGGGDEPSTDLVWDDEGSSVIEYDLDGWDTLRAPTCEFHNTEPGVVELSESCADCWDALWHYAALGEAHVMLDLWERACGPITVGVKDETRTTDDRR